MREKLMALIDEADKICDSYFRCDECPYRAEYGRNCINELITDHLIAHGVFIDDGELEFDYEAEM